MAEPPRQLRSVVHSLLADPKHGPLPALLLVLTVVTGLVDSVSILSLGRVFVANMTGNVVFVGFALAGAPGFALGASLFALGGFLVGASSGGLFIGRSGANRARLLRNAATAELVLVGIALCVSLAVGAPLDVSARDAIAAVTATALGIQNAVVRHLAVPDLTTTVLTMTLTGIAADLRARNRLVVARRMLAVSTMLGGAAFGALIVLNVNASAALGLAVALLAAVAAEAARTTRPAAAWHT